MFKDPNGAQYIVQDLLALESVVIPIELIKKPNFNVGRWYARLRKQSKLKDKTMCQHDKMGDAVVTVATKLLMDGIHSYYPSRDRNLDPSQRFKIFSPKPGRRNYLLADDDLGYLEKITKEDLEEPTFDLIDWYKQTIDEQALLEFKDRNGDDMVTMSSDEETSQDAHEGSTCQCHQSHCFIGCDQSEEIEEHDTEMTSVLEGSGLMYDDLPDLQTVSDSDLGYQDDVSNTGEDIPGLETVSNSDLDEDDDYQKDQNTNSREYMADLTDLLFEVFHQHDKEDPEESPSEKRETRSKEHHREEKRPSLCADEERINQWLSEILTESQSFPGDGLAIDPRFIIE